MEEIINVLYVEEKFLMYMKLTIIIKCKLNKMSLNIFNFNNYFTINNKLMYLKNADYEQYINNYNYPIYEDSKLDLQSINNYSLEIAPTPAHAVKAIYIKEIEALSGR